MTSIAPGASAAVEARQDDDVVLAQGLEEALAGRAELRKELLLVLGIGAQVGLGDGLARIGLGKCRYRLRRGGHLAVEG